jgi:hypothetical protein
MAIYVDCAKMALSLVLDVAKTAPMLNNPILLRVTNGRCWRRTVS